jgi:S1-C subfamily serine protease
MRSFAIVFGALSLATAVPAQEPAPAPAPNAYYFKSVRRDGDDGGDGAFLGVGTMQSGSKRDTLGLLVTNVTPGSPADKAGIAEGDRIASINGTSLRVAAADAGEPEMSGVMTRRLMREMSKVKAGDEVSLVLLAGGAAKTVKVKTVARDEMTGEKRRSGDRAVVGLNFGGGSRRDTLGLFVESVTPGGPADKAGIEEGNRIAAVNGTDVRIAAADAEDGSLVWAKQQRFTRILAALKAGDVVELRIYANGAYKTVKVTTDKASAVYGKMDRMMIHGMNGEVEAAMARVPMAPTMPMGPMAPMAPMPPMPPMHVRVSSGEGDGSAMRCVTTDENTIECNGTAKSGSTHGASRSSMVYSVTPEARAATGGGREINFDGLRLTSVSPDLASYFGAGSEKGLLVLEATADWAPLQTGDVVLSHNGRPVLRDNKNSSISINTDEENSFSVLRKGKKLTVKVKAQ